jgi:hypothetical protein
VTYKIIYSQLININNPYYIIVSLSLRDGVLCYVLLDVVIITLPGTEMGLWQVLF